MFSFIISYLISKQYLKSKLEMIKYCCRIRPLFLEMYSTSSNTSLFGYKANQKDSPMGKFLKAINVALDFQLGVRLRQEIKRHRKLTSELCLHKHFIGHITGCVKLLLGID